MSLPCMTSDFKFRSPPGLYFGSSVRLQCVPERSSRALVQNHRLLTEIPLPAFPFFLSSKRTVDRNAHAGKKDGTKKRNDYHRAIRKSVRVIIIKNFPKGFFSPGFRGSVSWFRRTGEFLFPSFRSEPTPPTDHYRSLPRLGLGLSSNVVNHLLDGIPAEVLECTGARKHKWTMNSRFQGPETDASSLQTSLATGDD